MSRQTVAAKATRERPTLAEGAPEFPLEARSWAAYANHLSGLVAEALRVMRGGGLAVPGVAEQLLQSRAAGVGTEG